MLVQDADQLAGGDGRARAFFRCLRWRGLGRRRLAAQPCRLTLSRGPGLRIRDLGRGVDDLAAAAAGRGASVTRWTAEGPDPTHGRDRKRLSLSKI